MNRDQLREALVYGPSWSQAEPRLIAAAQMLLDGSLSDILALRGEQWMVKVWCERHNSPRNGSGCQRVATEHEDEGTTCLLVKETT